MTATKDGENAKKPGAAKPVDPAKERQKRRRKTRKRIKKLVESMRFRTFIVVVIVINAIAIGIMTADTSPEVDVAMGIIDLVCLIIYVIETGLKLYAWGRKYFDDGWNRFDFIIILLSIIPDSLFPIPIQVARVLRILRVARAFRLVSAFKQLRVIVEAVGRSMGGVAWTGLLLLLIMYIFDVVGVTLFADTFPEYFGSLRAGLLTLFELATLEGWNELANTVMAVHPAAWLYFIPYIVVSAFIMLNVVVGIILNAVEESSQIERIKHYGDTDTQLAAQLAELKEQVETVQYLLEKREHELQKEAEEEAEAGAKAGETKPKK